jgi:hypothetical protein
MRFGTYENFLGDIYLSTETGFKEVPKYPHLPFQWVLERIVPVPHINEHELTTKVSYEPIWGFNNLPNRTTPNWETIKLICDTLLENIARGRSAIRKYKESLEETNTKEGQLARRELIKKEMFDGESDSASTALHLKTGIVVPESYKGEVQ